MQYVKLNWMLVQENSYKDILGNNCGNLNMDLILGNNCSFFLDVTRVL